VERRLGDRKILNRVISAVAILFGIMTIKSGGQVLFGEESYRIAAGNYVSFVVWFNFLAGFAYVAAGLGILFYKPWSKLLAMLIAGSSLLIFSVLGVHIFTDGAYEVRTIVAMTLRSIVWIGIMIFLFRNMKNGANHVA
jgi:hypothetical protein